MRGRRRPLPSEDGAQVVLPPRLPLAPQSIELLLGAMPGGGRREISWGRAVKFLGDGGNQWQDQTCLACVLERYR